MSRERPEWCDEHGCPLRVFDGAYPVAPPATRQVGPDDGDAGPHGPRVAPAVGPGGFHLVVGDQEPAAGAGALVTSEAALLEPVTAQRAGREALGGA